MTALPSPQMSWRKVLVVDDDEDIRATVASVLRDMEFLVEEACDGRQALVWLRGHLGGASVVLLDLMMPVMDGKSFLTAKAGDPLIAGVPVVVVTASGTCADIVRDHDVRGCLKKPFSVEELVRAVNGSSANIAA